MFKFMSTHPTPLSDYFYVLDETNTLKTFIIKFGGGIFTLIMIPPFTEWAYILEVLVRQEKA